jgi:hypothetical protein
MNCRQKDTRERSCVPTSVGPSRAAGFLSKHVSGNRTTCPFIAQQRVGPCPPLDVLSGFSRATGAREAAGVATRGSRMERDPDSDLGPRALDRGARFSPRDLCWCVTIGGWPLAGSVTIGVSGKTPGASSRSRRQPPAASERGDNFQLTRHSSVSSLNSGKPFPRRSRWVEVSRRRGRYVRTRRCALDRNREHQRRGDLRLRITGILEIA